MASRSPPRAIDWATALTAAALPEAQPYPRLYRRAGRRAGGGRGGAGGARLGGGAGALRTACSANSASGSISACVVTGARDGLGFVSPKSGAAVSVAAAEAMSTGCCGCRRSCRRGEAGWDDIVAGLRLTGHFLARDC